MAEKENSPFGRSFFSTMSSSINSFSQTIQTKGLPEFNKQLNKLHQQAKELPSRFGSLQTNLESERSSFITEKKNRENIITSQTKGSEPVAPWAGYEGYESKMKTAMMEIPKDHRNLTVSPPDDTNIQFDFNAYSVSAHAALKEDKELSRLRFELVPQHVSEYDFWRNYFYRVTLIKQDILSSPPEPTTDKKDEVLFDFQEKEDSDEEIVLVNKETIKNITENVAKIAEDKQVENHAKKESKEKAKETKMDKQEDNNGEYEGMEEWEIELRKAAI